MVDAAEPPSQSVSDRTSNRAGDRTHSGIRIAHRPAFWLLTTLLAIVCAGGLWWWHDTSNAAPRVPEIELTGVHRRVAAAISASSKIVRLRPESGSAWGGLGMTLQAHEYVDEALFCYRVAMDLDAQDFRWPYYSGVILSSSDRPSAISEFEHAARRNPSSAIVRIRLAELLMDVGHDDAAHRELEHVVGNEPDNAHACYLLSQLLLRSGENEQSLIWALKAAETAPRHRGVRELLAGLYSRMGDRAAANRELVSARQLPDATAGWGDPLLEEVEALRRDPRWTAYHAQWMIEQGDLAGGIRLLQRSLKYDTDDADEALLHADLADALLRANDSARAMAVLNRALALWPTSFELVRLRGVVFMLQRQWEDAERMLAQACGIIDDNAAVHFNRGLCLLELGRPDDALLSFEEAVRFDPNFADARAELARQLIRTAEPDRAREHLSIALQLVPEHKQARPLLESIDGRTP